MIKYLFISLFFVSLSLYSQEKRYEFTNPRNLSEEDFLQEKFDSLNLLVKLVELQREFYTMIQYEKVLLDYAIQTNMPIDVDDIRDRYFAETCDACMCYDEYRMMEGAVILTIKEENEASNK